MASDTVVGDRIHLTGPDLDLHGDAAHSDQASVQGLIAVRLGYGHIVLEATGHRLVQVVCHAKRSIAVIHLVNDDADAKHIDDVPERLALRLHLLVDGIQGLFPPAHLRFDAVSLQRGLERPRDLVHQRLVSRSPSRVDGPAEAVSPQRIQRLESEFLQFGAEIVHAEPIRDRRIEVEGLARDPPPLVQRHDADGAHVVQPVRQLYEDHPQVVGHRDGHLLKVLGLGLFMGLEHLPQLAHAIHDMRDFSAELRRKGLLGGTRVLEHVVEDRRRNGLLVHVHFGKDAGDRQRVGDVAVSRTTGLPGVGFLREAVRTHDDVDPDFREILR